MRGGDNSEKEIGAKRVFARPASSHSQPRQDVRTHPPPTIYALCRMQPHRRTHHYLFIRTIPETIPDQPHCPHRQSRRLTPHKIAPTFRPYVRSWCITSTDRLITLHSQKSDVWWSPQSSASNPSICSCAVLFTFQHYVRKQSDK